MELQNETQYISVSLFYAVGHNPSANNSRQISWNSNQAFNQVKRL